MFKYVAAVLYVVNTKFYIGISRQYLKPVWDVRFSHLTEYFGYSIVLTLWTANILEGFAFSRHQESLSKIGFLSIAISHVESVRVSMHTALATFRVNQDVYERSKG